MTEAATRFASLPRGAASTSLGASGRDGVDWRPDPRVPLLEPGPLAPLAVCACEACETHGQPKRPAPWCAEHAQHAVWLWRCFCYLDDGPVVCGCGGPHPKDPGHVCHCERHGLWSCMWDLGPGPGCELSSPKGFGVGARPIRDALPPRLAAVRSRVPDPASKPGTEGEP